MPGDGGLAHLKAELEQLAMDPGSTPSVLLGHLANEGPDLSIDLGSSLDQISEDAVDK